MKFNKKLVVTSLSTVLGLGIVGSITGTIAWYQYSTRGTASLIGTSAGESGVLQLRAYNGYDDDNAWKRDVASNEFFYTSQAKIRGEQIVGGTKSQDGLSIEGSLAFETDKDFYDTENDTSAWKLHGQEWTDKVIYFKNFKNWSKVYVYAWQGTGHENAPFPGQPMEKVENEDGVFKATLTHSNSSYSNVVFLDGSNYRADDKLRPCTWGAIQNNEPLPAQAYGNPILGVKEMTNWKPATSAVDYFQFTIQLKAVDKSSNAQGTLVERKVWITDIVLEDASNEAAVNDALRMHLHIEDGNDAHKKDMLIARTTNNTLLCHGELDLDGDGAPDTVGGYDWTQGRNQVVDYGHYVNDQVVTTPQTALGISSVVSTNFDELKSIGSTVAEAEQNQQYLKITVTVWLEGWATIGENNSAIWGPETLNKTIHAGLKFEISEDAFNTNN